MKNFLISISLAVFFQLIVSLPAYSQSDTLKIASVSYKIEGNQTHSDYIKKISRFIKKAHQNQAQVIIFPELLALDTWPLGQGVSGKELMRKISNNLTPLYIEHLKEWAQKYNMLIIGGSVPYKSRQSSSTIYNTTPIVFPNGKVKLYHKQRLTKWGKSMGLKPGASTKTFKTDWGTFSVLICYDIEHPELSVKLSKDRPEVIFVPSMTESPEGAKRVLWTAQARAIEQTSYVVVSSTTGKTTSSWKHFGNSTIIEPKTKEFKVNNMSKPKTKQSITYKTISLRNLRKTRNKSNWQPALSIK